MTAVAFPGERTLIARPAGMIHPTGDATHRGVQTFVPGIPIGQVVIPKVDFLRLLLSARFEEVCRAEGWPVSPRFSSIVSDTITGIESEIRALQRQEPALVTHLQTIITAAGTVDTISALLACQFARECLGDEVAARLERDLKLKAREALGEDRKGGEVASCESLSALHRAAGSPKGCHPGHWRYRRRHFVDHVLKERPGKGIWRAESGDWWADHELATDYACLLFPDFHVFTIHMVMLDPGVDAMLNSLFGVPAVPAPHLRLVHDAGAGSDGGAA